MKKYVKPDLYYENFELSHHVASCEDSDKGTLTSKNKNECAFEYIGEKFFTTCDACKIKDVSMFCYQTGSGLNIFAS